MDQNFNNIYSTLFISLIQFFATLCNIISTNNFYSLYNIELYNFIHNGMNILQNLYDILIELFMEELKIRDSYIIIDIIYIIIINSFLYFLIYYIINKAYISIVNKKMSYLEAFYGIKLHLIKSSIQKCEIFINKLGLENKDDFFESIDDENSIKSNSLSKEKIKQNETQNSENKNNSKEKFISDKNFLNFYKFYLYYLFYFLIYIFKAFLFILLFSTKNLQLVQNIFFIYKIIIVIYYIYLIVIENIYMIIILLFKGFLLMNI